MLSKLFKSVLFPVCFLFSFGLSAQTTNLKCGFTATPAQQLQYKTIVNYLSTHPTPTLSGSLINQTIPVYFWVNKSDITTLPTVSTLKQSIDRLNLKYHFNNGAQFVFCGVKYLNDANFYNVDVLNYTQVNSVFNTYYC